MQDKPSPDILLKALADFLRQKVATQLSGHTAFEAHVAHNVLGILQREVRFGQAFEQAQQTRLMALLKQKGSLLVLNEALCQKIRDGTLSYADPALRLHLRKAIMGKLAIDQPRYARYVQAQADGWAEEDGWAAD